MINIYVGNLSYQATEQELREMFASHGEVGNVTIIKDRDSGRSKGFGFVEMNDNSAGPVSYTHLTLPTIYSV